jgi:hypothetical protein
MLQPEFASIYQLVSWQRYLCRTSGCSPEDGHLLWIPIVVYPRESGNGDDKKEGGNEAQGIGGITSPSGFPRSSTPTELVASG